MNKFERVQLPRKLGLNAENSVLVKSMRELKNSVFVKSRSAFSVRTYYSDPKGRPKKSPHLVTTSKKSLLEKAPKLFKDGLYLIVADKIDAKDCKFRGTIWIMGTTRKIIEIAHGPGTVRTVTNDGVIDESHDISRNTVIKTGNEKLDYCIRRCNETRLGSVIFEFSYYKTPVGWKNERFICWEITDDGTRQCPLFKE